MLMSSASSLWPRRSGMRTWLGPFAWRRTGRPAIWLSCAPRSITGCVPDGSLDTGRAPSGRSRRNPIVAEIRQSALSAPSAELAALIERAAGHVVKVILHADDSNGSIGDVARELLDLHARVCDARVSDPVKLARWMVRFCFDDQDFFELDPIRYAAALGESGLAAYRHEVHRRVERGDTSFAAAFAQERLAVLDGDADEIVRLLGGDLRTPYQFIRVAEAMDELGRDDDLLAWARRGIAETTGWQVAKLYDLACGVHARQAARPARPSSCGSISTVGCHRRPPTSCSATPPRRVVRGARSGIGPVWLSIQAAW